MIEFNLTGKKVLYIGLVSFHYDRYFVEKLIALGAEVDAYDFKYLYPKGLFSKIAGKVNPRNKTRYKNRFYEKVLSVHGYDYVLVRQGYQLDLEFLQKLRIGNAKAKFINFHWDSIRPQFDYSRITRYFDKVFSFDIKDCQNHPEITYLPLFYLDIYGQFNTRGDIEFAEKKIDILFIGSWRNTERYELIQLTEKLCLKAQLRFYHHLYFSLKNQLRSLRKGTTTKKATAKRLTHEQIVGLFARSRTIIDFPSSFQTGLTMRTFEALGAGLKLITTNKNIVNEPFYTPEYINVLDIDNFQLNIDFIKHPPKVPMDNRMVDYSIGNYIGKLLK